METRTYRQSRSTAFSTVAIAALVFTTELTATRESWPQRVEADWLLAEEVAAQGSVPEPLTTKADANSVAPPQRMEVDWAVRTRKRLAVCERLAGEYGDTFSLTLTLSRWEREIRLPVMEKSKTGASSSDVRAKRSGRKLSPLPQGKGQGEGERHASSTNDSLKPKPTTHSTNQSAKPLFYEARRLQRQLALDRKIPGSA